jgi:osmotically-inducible protein OsmY
MRTLEEIHIGRLAGALLLAFALALFAATAVGAKGEAGEAGKITAKETETEGKRTVGSTINDGWIARTINTTYMFDRRINSFDVNAEAKRGVVTVIGYVTDASTRDRALEVAHNTLGVKEVVDKLIVDPDYKAKLAKGELLDKEGYDKWMSIKVRKQLINDAEVTGTWVGVKADDGHVTLKGMVDKRSEIERAEEIASEVPGVKEVKNELICCRM